MATSIIEHSKSVGYEQITGLSAVKTLTVPSYEGIKARKALIQAETQSVRVRNDGTDPTAAVGLILTANTIFEFAGDLESLEFIETAASAKLNVLYFI